MIPARSRSSRSAASPVKMSSILGQRLQRRLVPIDGMNRETLAPQRRGGGLADLAGADDDHRARSSSVSGQLIVQGEDLVASRRRPARCQRRITVCGKGRAQLAALPEAHDAESGPLPQLGVAHGDARQTACRGRVAPPYGAPRNSPMTCASAGRPRRDWPDTRQAATSAAAPPWRRSTAASQWTPLLRRWRQSARGRDLAHGERDVRVGRVLAIGEHQRAHRRRSALVGLPAVVFPGQRTSSPTSGPAAPDRARSRNTGSPRAQPLDEPGGDGVVFRR